MGDERADAHLARTGRTPGAGAGRGGGGALPALRRARALGLDPERGRRLLGIWDPERRGLNRPAPQVYAQRRKEYADSPR